LRAQEDEQSLVTVSIQGTLMSETVQAAKQAGLAAIDDFIKIVRAMRLPPLEDYALTQAVNELGRRLFGAFETANQIVAED
jgi:hypothetical protein